MVMTDSMGNYALSGFGSGAYTVTPSRTAQPCVPSGPNGIFANDAGLVSQHVVGLITLSPDQQIAGKVAGPLTPELSALDAAFIAQKTVGLCSGNNLSGQWVFSPVERRPPRWCHGQPDRKLQGDHDRRRQRRLEPARSPAA